MTEFKDDKENEQCKCMSNEQYKCVSFNDYISEESDAFFEKLGIILCVISIIPFVLMFLCLWLYR